MVRHDPINVRGPAPPGGRPVTTSTVRKVPETLFQLQPVEEYENLWKTVVASTEHSINVLALYTRLQMPVNFLPDLIELRDRLNVLIKLQEARNE